MLGAAFFYRTCHSFFLQDSRIALVTDITAILQNPCYHIFVPDPSNIVWNLLLPKPLNQAVVGFSGDIRLEDMLYQHCLRWMRYDFSATSAALAALKQEMQSLSSQLPEYPVVMDMFGVGPTLGPQLIAEIGDVRRFYSKKALVAYAGIDAPPNDSGDVIGRHKSMSKVGASSLRRTLFLVMSVYLQNSPPNEPIYQFMNRKRAEGKPYRVYMMASANKFLRIYYATVKAYLETLEQS